MTFATFQTSGISEFSNEKLKRSVSFSDIAKNATLKTLLEIFGILEDLFILIALQSLITSSTFFVISSKIISVVFTSQRPSFYGKFIKYHNVIQG